MKPERTFRGRGVSRRGPSALSRLSPCLAPTPSSPSPAPASGCRVQDTTSPSPAPEIPRYYSENAFIDGFPANQSLLHICFTSFTHRRGPSASSHRAPCLAPTPSAPSPAPGARGYSIHKPISVTLSMNCIRTTKITTRFDEISNSKTGVP